MHREKIFAVYIEHSAKNMPLNPDTLDFQQLISTHPWVVERNQQCVLSPDSDGLLCGLFMSHYLDWTVKGFYDGKVLLLADGVQASNCVFLDMEFFRPHIKSIGQHMVMFNKKHLPANWSNFKNSISANNLRAYDFVHDFKRKYPFGTIHLLLAIIGHTMDVHLKKSAVSPLLYTDGTFKNQFNYPENCLDWLTFLSASDGRSPLQKVFLDRQYSVYELMMALQDLFNHIHTIGNGKKGGDKIKISDSKGRSVNMELETRRLNRATIEQAEQFLSFLASKTGWQFVPNRWSWGPYNVEEFTKGRVKPGKARYEALLENNPLSLAIISRESIEYTLDTNGVFK